MTVYLCVHACRGSLYTHRMDRAGSLLPRVLRKRGIYDEARAALLVHRARQWLSERFGSASDAYRPLHLRCGVLTIACTHSAAQHEGQLASADLLTFLQSDGERVLTGVTFTRSGGETSGFPCTGVTPC
jgi:hypothetical protein